MANALSVQLQVPVGLYDLDKVKGDELIIRLGTEGEGYTGIGKERVNVPAAFASPTPRVLAATRAPTPRGR